MSKHGRVLVVEDDESLCRILKRNLAARGIEAVCAESVAAALQSIAAARPDLLVLDINLPDRSGWELCRALRARGLEIPKIILSATRVTPERLAEFNPLAFLPKPFPLEALLRLVVEREGANVHASNL
jgi:DNA-binding response OmpR family regulator